MFVIALLMTLSPFLPPKPHFVPTVKVDGYHEMLWFGSYYEVSDYTRLQLINQL